MSQSEKARPAAAWPVYLALILLGFFVLLFLIEFISASQATETTSETEGTISASRYMDIVEPLLVDTDVEHGEALITTYGCVACHVAGAGRVAPAFTGISVRAAERHPPLTAEAYLYESIINPSAYVVEEFGDAMRKDYAQAISDDELGDIIAYLMTQ